MMRRTYGAKEKSSPSKYWVQLEHYLLACPAYVALSANAKVVYTEVKRRYRGNNNGLISISSREAAEAIGQKTHHSTGARALLELIEHGFIIVTEDSSFNRKVHLARQYRLTEAKDDRPGSKLLATKEFLRWSPKSKTQSHQRDTTVAPTRHQTPEAAYLGYHSRPGATVRTASATAQSHPCDTSRLSAIRGVGAGPELRGEGLAPLATQTASKQALPSSNSQSDLAPISEATVQVTDSLRRTLRGSRGVARG
jgi:hypothetical protein